MPCHAVPCRAMPCHGAHGAFATIRHAGGWAARRRQRLRSQCGGLVSSHYPRANGDCRCGPSKPEPWLDSTLLGRTVWTCSSCASAPRRRCTPRPPCTPASLRACMRACVPACLRACVQCAAIVRLVSCHVCVCCVMCGTTGASLDAESSNGETAHEASSPLHTIPHHHYPTTPHRTTHPWH